MINAARDRAPKVSPDARVLPLWRASHVDVMADAEHAALREAVERLLAADGVTVPSPEARARLRARGADVDDAHGVVRLPAPLVVGALEGATDPFILAGRDPVCDLTIDGSAAWLSGGAVVPAVEDLETGQRRPRAAADLVQAALLADAVPQVGLVGPVAATDVVRDLPRWSPRPGSTSSSRCPRTPTTCG